MCQTHFRKRPGSLAHKAHCPSFWGQRQLAWTGGHRNPECPGESEGREWESVSQLRTGQVPGPDKRPPRAEVAGFIELVTAGLSRARALGSG